MFEWLKLLIVRFGSPNKNINPGKFPIFPMVGGGISLPLHLKAMWKTECFLYDETFV